jgi:hypothetical protein
VPAPAQPPGWYPDPQSDRHWRWWDGTSWSQHSAPRFAPVAIDSSRIRPRAWTFALAAIPAVLGLAAAVVLAISAFDAGSNTFNRLTEALVPLRAPGSVTLSLDAGEKRTIYRPAAASNGGKSGLPVADLRCEVLGPGGARAEATASDNVNLQQNGRHYRSLFDFTAPASGANQVRCRSSSDQRGSVALDIGPHFDAGDVLDVLLPAVGAFAALLLGVGLGVGVGVLVGVLRDRSRKRLQAEAAEQPGPGDAEPQSAKP